MLCQVGEQLRSNTAKLLRIMNVSKKICRNLHFYKQKKISSIGVWGVEKFN